MYLKFKEPHVACGYYISLRWSRLPLAKRLLSWHPVKNLILSSDIWKWVWLQPQKIQLAVTKPLKEWSYHRNGNRGMWPRLGKGSVMTSDPRLFLFSCSAVFLVLLFCYVIPTCLQHLQAFCSTNKQKRGAEGKWWPNLCQPGLSLFPRKPKSLLRRLIWQTSPCVMWPDLCQKLMPTGREDRRAVQLGAQPFCTKSVSCWQERVLPVSQYLFPRISVGTHAWARTSTWLPECWLRGNYESRWHQLVTCLP